MKQLKVKRCGLYPHCQMVECSCYDTAAWKIRAKFLKIFLSKKKTK